MDANDIKFRCSALGYLMTNSKTKGELSETTKNHLIDIYVAEKYKRQTDIFNKYLEKGKMVEEDSLTLFSRVTKTFYTKNKEHYSNEFIKGTPDIVTVDKIVDIKSAWDIFTYYRNLNKDLNKLYYWQLQGYMWLTGIKKATLAYCLVNTPQSLIVAEQKKLYYRMGVIDEYNPTYIEACHEIERLAIYDDIPLIERVLTIDFELDDEKIESLKSKILECRTFLNKLFNQ